MRGWAGYGLAGINPVTWCGLSLSYPPQDTPASTFVSDSSRLPRDSSTGAPPSSDSLAATQAICGTNDMGVSSVRRDFGLSRRLPEPYTTVREGDLR